jgi:uncharacterized membrane protein
LKSKQIIVALIIFIILSALLWHFFWNFESPEMLSEFGQFYSGTLGIIIVIAAAVIAFKTYNQQVKVTQYQNFENIFLKMLEMNEKNVKSMDITFLNGPDISKLKDKNAFEIIYHSFKENYNLILNRNNTSLGDSKSNEVGELAIIKKAYIEFSNEYLIVVGPYLRHLYYLLNYVDDQSFLKNKLFYINMIRTQISANELLLLFYACLSERGYKKFKPLVEKYGILSHIEHIKEKLIKVEHRNLFDEKAFIEPSSNNA